MSADSTLVEVELKLFLQPDQKETLQAGMSVHQEKAFWDTYYDVPSHVLSCQDWWLRQRGANWELKVPWFGGHDSRGTHSYEEVVEHSEILGRLGEILGENIATEEFVSMEAILKAIGLAPFARLHTARTSLRASDDVAASFGVRTLQVDMDTVTFDPSFAEQELAAKKGAGEPFVLAEVEVVTERQQEAVNAAEEAVDLFLEEWGLKTAPTAYSKLLEYMSRLRPTHLDALGRVGIVPDVALAQRSNGLAQVSAL
eukprot:CAMPEP_0170603982 /NCGR_PEP_ID=MMETSP0224-20130122/19189_1 /TAXON_ID=285029 /ORGANISM="Togula jolla, Strain CCCM 725" /LENGTH=255 /DNA_ID=CAMNT_0010928873 /DNA_START=90 /DNA_END=857 /DNA_ORIENTATION=-